MRIVIAVVCTLVLASCSKTEGMHVESAVRLCADHGGVSSLRRRLPLDWSRVTCLDGAEFKIEARPEQ